MRHPGRSLYGDAPQVHAVNRRHVLVHERRFGHQPEQPRYKLGPRHHGVLERGCKTASGSHISWPAHIGAFSLVMGHCAPGTDSSEWAILLPRGARLVPLRDSRHYLRAWERCATSGNGLHATAARPKCLKRTGSPSKHSPLIRWGVCSGHGLPWKN